MVTVFFRYDDYSSLSPCLVDHELISTFARHQMTCTFAVVPSITSLYPEVQGQGMEVPLTAEKIEELRSAVQLGAVDVALHGWNHLANAFSPPPVPSEFCGLSVEHQTAILGRGKKALKDMLGVNPIVFVPPWNTYDDATLEALVQVGFVGLSANRYSSISPAGENLSYAPMTVEIGGLRNAIEVARISKEKNAVIGVMLHPYDFQESRDGRSVMSLTSFDRELSWLGAQHDVRVVSITALMKSSEGMDASRFSANRPSAFESVFPEFIPKVFSDPLYSTVNAARNRQRRRYLCLFAFLLSVLFVSCIGGWIAGTFLSKFHDSLATIVVFGLLSLLALLVVRAVRLKAIYSRALLTITILFGVCLGLALS